MDEAKVKATLDERADDAVAKKRRAAAIRTGALAVTFVVLVLAVDAFTHGDFLTARNVTNVLRQITVNAIMAVGQTFVIITAGIDLSVGSLVGVSGVVGALVANAVHLPAPAAFVVTLLAALAVGCAAGWVNAIPVVKLNLPPFITTLAMMQVARGAAYILSHGEPIPVQNTAPFDWLGTGTLFATGSFPGIPWVVVVMAVVAVVFAIVLGRTPFGRYVLALGGNEEAARLAGFAAVGDRLRAAGDRRGRRRGNLADGRAGNDRRDVLRRAADRRPQQRDEPAQRRIVHADDRARRGDLARRGRRRAPQALPGRALSLRGQRAASRSGVTDSSSVTSASMRPESCAPGPPSAAGDKKRRIGLPAA
jgi:predicted ABC-type sugar transport system permease subunit